MNGQSVKIISHIYIVNANNKIICSSDSQCEFDQQNKNTYINMNVYLKSTKNYEF